MSSALLADQPKLWVPESALRGVEVKPYVARGTAPVVIKRPLDLRGEVAEYVRDLRRDIARRRDFLRTGIMPIAGAAAGSWTFTNNSRTYLLDGTFDLNTDTFLVALFLSTSNLGASTSTYAGVTNEHSNANGYTTGGISYGALVLSGTTTVTVDDGLDAVWTASGGSITARFAAIYESSGNVLCYCLLDSTPADVTATSGNTLTLALNASGIFTLA